MGNPLYQLESLGTIFALVMCGLFMWLQGARIQGGIVSETQPKGQVDLKIG